MEAAEKIPKKLYVYLDTTRGAHHRNGGQAVRGGRAGAGVRHQRQRGLWPDPAPSGTGLRARRLTAAGDGGRGSAARPLFLMSVYTKFQRESPGGAGV